MNDTLLDVWHYSPKNNASTVIIPDGCRDLIMLHNEGDAPFWFVSSLFDQAEEFKTNTKTRMIGFRLKPGAIIQENLLLLSIEDEDEAEIKSRIYDFSDNDYRVNEALACLATGTQSVNEASSLLGVNPRTLQRLLIHKTSRTPLYWIMLARVRKAARMIFEDIPYANIAYECNYSDQAHLCREVKKWFNSTPSKLRQSDTIRQQINSKGYD